MENANRRAADPALKIRQERTRTPFTTPSIQRDFFLQLELGFLDVMDERRIGGWATHFFLEAAVKAFMLLLKRADM
tara:strand:+ start:12978 stop:13205 length:228 start_codon:yes stop_codon:yes gene_type:complete